MNIVDLAIAVILVIFVLYGLYRGFLRAALSLAAVVFAVALALAFHPLLDHLLEERFDVSSRLLYFVDGAAENLANYDLLAQDVSEVSPETLDEILDSSGQSEVVCSVLRDNVENRSYASMAEIRTLGDYFTHTLTRLLMDVVGFILLFFILLIVFEAIIGICKAIWGLPMLRLGDSLLGGMLGLVCGVLVFFVLFAIVPVVLSLLPVTFINRMLDASFFSNIFYQNNFILRLLCAGL